MEQKFRLGDSPLCELCARNLSRDGDHRDNRCGVGPDLVLMTESTTARRRGGEFYPSAVATLRAALGVGDQRLERLAGGDVDDLVGDAVADRQRVQLVAVHVEGEAVAGGRRA